MNNSDRPSLANSSVPRGRSRFISLSLILPLLVFTIVTFLLPLVQVFTLSVYEAVVSDVLPNTLNILEGWDRNTLPSDEAYDALAIELIHARQNKTIGQVAVRVNRLQSGARSTLIKTAARLRQLDPTSINWKQEMLRIDNDWSEIEIWQAIQVAGDRFTARYFLQSFDLMHNPDKNISLVDESRRIYVALFVRTLMVSVVVTMLCLVVGYPVAYLIAHVSDRFGRFLLVLVLIPFWTSLLVRTTSWIVLLQQQGVLNDLLVAIGLVADDQRITMVYNMTGTLIAMTHVLLPFMILPLYSVMRNIDSSYVSAAQSLGANPLQSFIRVYWPQSLPGVAAGSILVFIMTIGFYITPALVGGTDGQLISNMIAYHIQSSLNWNLAAALSTVLLITVIILYVLYDRVVGIDRMKLG